MSNEKENQFVSESRSLQDYLSMGYLFLLVVGLAREVIYYNFLGINIINYSDVLDVLLSPVAYVVHNVPILIAVMLMAAYIYWFSKKAPAFHEKHKSKKWYKKLYNVEKRDKWFAAPLNLEGSLKLFAGFVLSFFVGTGIGSGMKAVDKLEKRELKSDTTLIFNDKETINVTLIGQNGQYVFYVEEGKGEIVVAPISGNIKKIIAMQE